MFKLRLYTKTRYSFISICSSEMHIQDNVQ